MTKLLIYTDDNAFYLIPRNVEGLAKGSLHKQNPASIVFNSAI